MRRPSAVAAAPKPPAGIYKPGLGPPPGRAGAAAAAGAASAKKETPQERVKRLMQSQLNKTSALLLCRSLRPWYHQPLSPKRTGRIKWNCSPAAPFACFSLPSVASSIFPRAFLRVNIRSTETNAPPLRRGTGSRKGR